MARFLAAADQFCSFEAIDFGHAHIEKYGRKVVLQAEPECVTARGNEQKLLIKRLEHRMQREQVVAVVVDKQELYAVHSSILYPAQRRHNASSVLVRC